MCVMENFEVETIYCLYELLLDTSEGPRSDISLGPGPSNVSSYTKSTHKRIQIISHVDMLALRHKVSTHEGLRFGQFAYETKVYCMTFKDIIQEADLVLLLTQHLYKS